MPERKSVTTAEVDRDRPLTVRFPASMLDDLRVTARRDERSLNGEIVWLLRQQLLGRPSCDDRLRAVLAHVLRALVYANDVMPEALGARFGELKVASWLADASEVLRETDDRVVPKGGHPWS